MFDNDVLKLLLRDRTTKRNILWATHDYETLGAGYQYADEIQLQDITGENSNILKPRVLKSKEQQSDRSKDMAEVFTPSWICKAQNDLVDVKAYWHDYVRTTCLEITCGEAPYLVSRYDATTGEAIPIGQRIGLLDRKLRTVGENTADESEWLEWTRIAYQNIYGYEWQGDNLLLARMNLLHTFIDYFQAKFDKQPAHESVCGIADIISWNLWQMDGLKGVVPGSCHDVVVEPADLFGGEAQTSPCLGCANEEYHLHNGIYCTIFDWEKNETIRYIDLIS